MVANQLSIIVRCTPIEYLIADHRCLKTLPRNSTSISYADCDHTRIQIVFGIGWSACQCLCEEATDCYPEQISRTLGSVVAPETHHYWNGVTNDTRRRE
jgi:hypothetical protein